MRFLLTVNMKRLILGALLFTVLERPSADPDDEIKGEIQGIERAAEIIWEGTNGEKYLLQKSINLNNWETVDTLRGSGKSMSVLMRASSQLQFWRLQNLTQERLKLDTPSVEVSNVRKVFDNGHHNAFTDLIEFEGVYYLTFRSCPDGHGVSPNASIIILVSSDTIEWRQVHTFRVPRRDTRDPHFLAFKDRLFVYTGTWYSGNEPVERYSDLDLNLHMGYASLSEDGNEWTEPIEMIGTFGHYIWRAAAFGEKAFLCGRRKIEFEVGLGGEPKEVESLMLESDDGLNWRKRATFQEIAGDETAFLFNQNESVLAIGRREHNATAQLLQSNPPYKKWIRRDLDRHIGGPLIARWGSRIIVGGRHATETGPKTSMCWLVGSELHEFAELPSGGDNSYPGFIAITPTEAVMSWYSSHEGKSSIYLADLKLKQ